jgi:hypothetical protein
MRKRLTEEALSISLGKIFLILLTNKLGQEQLRPIDPLTPIVLAGGEGWLNLKSRESYSFPGSHKPLVLISSVSFAGGVPAENRQLLLISMGDRPKAFINPGPAPLELLEPE